jgi:hypothetical protein
VKRVDIGRKVEQRRNAASHLMKPELSKKMGGFALVFELVPSAVAEITQSGSIPSFPHSCKPELRQKAAVMGSGPGEVRSGPDETVEIRRRHQPLQLVGRARSTKVSKESFIVS